MIQVLHVVRTINGSKVLTVGTEPEQPAAPVSITVHPDVTVWLSPKDAGRVADAINLALNGLKELP